MRRFNYAAPSQLAEACDLLADRASGARPLAGGTDLLIQMKERGREVPLVVSLRNLKDMCGITENTDGSLTIGAMETGSAVHLNEAVRRHAEVISEGAELIGSIQIRNRGTIGGNVGNASPAADCAPGLVATGATARVAGPKGERQVPVGELMAGPSRLNLQPGELLVSFTVPKLPPRTGTRYIRHVPRREMDIAIVGVGAVVTLEDDDQTIKDAQIVLAASAPTWLHAVSAERALRGKQVTDKLLEQAGEAASADAQPISDVRATAEYRKLMVAVFTRRALTTALARARGAS